MANIKVEKNQEKQVININPGDRVDFNFYQEDCVNSKDGNDHIVSFTDGSQIIVVDFYIHSQNTMAFLSLYNESASFTAAEMASQSEEYKGVEGEINKLIAEGENPEETTTNETPENEANAEARESSFNQAFTSENVVHNLEYSTKQDALNNTEILDPVIFKKSNNIDNTANTEDITAPPIVQMPSTPEAPAIAPVFKNENTALEFRVKGIENINGDPHSSVGVSSAQVELELESGSRPTFGFIDANGNEVDVLNTKYGTITIDAQGQLVYTLNNSADLRALQEGSIINSTIQVFVKNNGGSDVQDVNITIHGSNDRPYWEFAVKDLALQADGETGLDGVNTITGVAYLEKTAEGKDDDASSSLTYSLESSDSNTSDYGTFSFDTTTGLYSFTLDNSKLAVQNLLLNQTKTLEYVIKVTDEKGAYQESTIQVVITGGNHAPELNVSKNELVVSADSVETNNATINGVVQDNGSSTNSDIDFNLPQASYSLASTDPNMSKYGTFVLNTNTGAYEFRLDQTKADVQSLYKGETKDLFFTVRVTDSANAYTEETIKVTITGGNDAPELSISNQLIVALGKTSDLGDSIGTDQDHKASNNEGLKYYIGSKGNLSAQDIEGLGTFTINETTGKYSYTLNSSTTTTDNKHFEFTIYVYDKHGAYSQKTVSVEINPVGLSTSELYIKESGYYQIGSGAANNSTSEYTGNNPASDLSNSAQNNYQQLSATGSTNYNGTGGVASRFELVDKNGNVIYGQSITTTYGTLVYRADGTYTYTLNYSKLEAGDSITETFYVRAVGTQNGVDKILTLPSELKVTVHGTNDKPYFTLANGTIIGNTDSVNDNAGIYEHGVGRDNNDFTTVNPNISNNPFADSNDFHNDNNNVFDTDTRVANGQLHSSDSNNADKANLIYTIAKNSGSTPSSWLENGTTQIEIQGANGKIILNADGSYTYTLDSKLDTQPFNYLAQGEKAEIDSFFVYVKDQYGAYTEKKLVINITGTNDKPVISGVDYVTSGSGATAYTNYISKNGLAEDGLAESLNTNGNLVLKEGGYKLVDGSQTLINAGIASGKVKVTDVDNNDSHTFFLLQVEGIDGKSYLVTTQNGQYGYTSATGFQSIDVTDPSLKFSLVTKAFDQYGSTITIANNTYTYYLNEENSAVQNLHSKSGSGLSQANTLNSGFVVVAKDKAGAMHHKDIDVTIVGTEDKPIFLSSGDYKASSFHTLKESSSNPDGSIAAPGTDTASMKFKAQDFDNNDTNSLSYKAQFNSTSVNLDSSTDGATTQVNTQYGKVVFTFHNDADGKWFSYTYTLDNSSAHLFKEGQTFQEKMKIIASDPTQLTGEKELTFNIQGSNDAPTFTVSSTNLTRDVSIINGTTKEDTNLSFSGDLHGADIDNGAVLSFSIYDGATNKVLQIIQGTYGKLEIDYYTGEYTYTLDNTLAQKFAQDFVGYENFTVRVTDEFGAFDSRNIKITITGTNDSPVISGTSAKVSEAGENSRFGDNGDTTSEDILYDNTNANPLNTAPPSISGKINIADVDQGDSHAISGSSEANVEHGIATYQGTYGTLTLNLSTGEYTYTLNKNNTEAIQKLGANASVNESFDFTVKTTNNGSIIEETNSSINITINGINDKPYFTGNKVISGGTITTNENITSDLPTVATKIEMSNQVLLLSGKFTGADIDTGDTFDFNLFGVRNPDTGSYVAIKFDGVNYIRTDNNSIVEAKDLVIMSTVKGVYGALTIKADGSYVYEIDINGPVWSLALGTKGTDIFTVTIKDQNGAWVTKELQIEVQTPDTGIFGPGNTPPDDTLYLDNIISSTAEEIPISPTGITPQGGSTITIANAFIGFRGADGNQVQTIINDYGTLTINAKTGEYSFSFHNTEWVNSLAPGQQITLSYELMARNANVYLAGTTTTPKITITINGVADKPTVGLEKNTFSVQEDTTYLDSGNMEGKVFDRYWISGMGESHVDNTVAMNTLSYTFSYGQKTTTITGARGEVVKGIMNSFTENVHFTLTFNETTGSLEFELTTAGNALIQGLRTGENFNLHLSLQVTDKNGTHANPINITLTVNGKNEAPTLELAADNYVFEDGATGTQIPETVIINDKEYEVKQIVSGVANGNAESGSGNYGVEKGVNGLCIGLYGSLVIDKITGAYTYTLNNALASVQALQEGEYAYDIFTITFTDNSGQIVSKELKITLVGDADTPILTIDNPFHEYLDGSGAQKTFTKQVQVRDNDLNDTHTYTLSKVEDGTSDSALLQLSYGNVTISTSGSYTYTVDNELIKALARNETLTEKFWVKVTDSKGLTDTKEVVITLTGENDAPEFDKPHFNFTQNNQELSGTLSATDPDHGSIVYYFMRNPDNSTTQVLDGKYGTLTILYATGEFIYTIKDGYTLEDLKLMNDEHFTIWAKDEYCTDMNDPNDSVTSQNFKIDFAGNKLVNTSVPSSFSLNTLFDNAANETANSTSTHNFFDNANISVTLPVDDTSDNATMHQLLYANG